jgi:predicted NAD/FAD-dependent oxidoreductase
MKHGPVKWIADHQKRGISQIPTYTAHLSAQYSQETWNLPQEQVVSRISPNISTLLGTNLKTAHMHRWKYANLIQGFPQMFYLQQQPLPLILAGDGFGSGGVEGAVLSGIEAARAIKNSYQTR